MTADTLQTFGRGELVFDLSDTPPTGPDTGEVVVLLHGFPQNRHEWDDVAPALAAAGYRVVAPDQRGYSPGARPTGRHAYVTAELVADVLALIDTVGADKVHLVGHDWGAVVAWALASAHPDRLLSLTAISVPHPSAMMWAMPRGQALKSWYMAAFQLPVLPERLLLSPLGERFLGATGMTRDMQRRYVAPLGRDGLTATINWYRGLPLGRDRRFGHRSSVPTLYVWSDGDTALGRAGAEATARYVTGPYRFEVLSGRNHWLPDQAPDEVAKLIIEQARAYGAG